MKEEGRRKKEEGRRKKEEGRRKKEEGSFEIWIGTPTQNGGTVEVGVFNPQLPDKINSKIRLTLD